MMKTVKIMKNRCKNKSGFTLIEVIAVLIILAIVSAVVISRVTATDTAKLQAEVNTLKGHLRYAQYLAMNDIAPVKWGINVGGSSYTLAKVDNTGTTNPYSLPGDSSATHSFASGISASSSATPILFDEWGSPGIANINITLSGQTITIYAGTGFIP